MHCAYAPIDSWVHYIHTLPHCAVCPRGSSDVTRHTQLTQKGPRRAQMSQFELFELFVSPNSDERFSIVQFEPTVSRSTVIFFPYTLIYTHITRCVYIRLIVVIYYIMSYHIISLHYTYIYIYIYWLVFQPFKTLNSVRHLFRA